jgi:hypothetical protein
VQWNPGDTRRVAAEITFAEHAVRHWAVGGCFAAARPAG